MPQVSCPQCGQAQDLTGQQWLEYQGLQIPCPRCGGRFVVGGAGSVARPMPYAPAGGYPPPGPYADFGPPKPNRAAFWALVFGALSFFLSFLAGIPAVVLGIIGMKRASADRSTGGQGMALTGLVLGIIGSFLGCGFISLMTSILLPSLNRAREQANAVKCAGSMRQIGMALHVYAEKNKGRFPDSVDALVKQGYLKAPVQGCPTHGPAGGGGGGAGQTVTPPGYVYIGKGLKDSSEASVVLLYEEPAHNGGMNVLYSDGQVEYFGRDTAARLLADLQAGRNPPNMTGGK